MHVQVEQGQLQQALQKVTRAVSVRTTLPVLSGVLLEVTADGLRLTAYDLEVAIQTTIPAQVQEPGRTVLPARYLHEVVRRIPPGLITLRLEPESLRTTITWGRSKYDIHGLPPEQFPPLGSFNEATLEIAGDLLHTIFSQTGFAVATEETRPALMGVHVNINNGTARAIATDGFRVAVRETELAGSGQADFILPGRSLQEISRLLPQEGGEPVVVRTVDNQAEFAIGDTRVISRLIEGPYPNVLELLPTEYRQTAVVDRLALEAALERASLLADGRSSARWLVVLTLADDLLTITADDPEVGQAYEEISAQLDGEGIRIGFNARYLLEGLRHMEDDQVELSFIDPVKAVRIRGVGADAYQYVVFPVRL
ncbi:MAG TPA: DNA polymerase III subunit beta [Sphingobacteriaceae bacterium]|nr:DNA polymerase III subunit beta [Sphingobacteriaceae bacterium]